MNETMFTDRLVGQVIGLSTLFMIALFCYIIAAIFKFIFRKIRESMNQNNSNDKHLSVNNNNTIYLKKPRNTIYDSIVKCPYCGKEYPIRNYHFNKNTFCRNCNNFFIIK